MFESLSNTLAASAIGIGFRQPHYQSILEECPEIDFLEVHSENFFHAGGASLHALQRAREHYPISLHGVGLSLASADAVQAHHVRKLQQLIQRIEPTLISEHLSWGAIGQTHFNDLLPLPHTEEALQLVCQRVDYLQTLLKRRVLLENLSAYVQFRDTTMHELEFLRQVSQRTGCGILLDINNLYVNSCNFDDDPWPYLYNLTHDMVGEIHLAGHTRTADCLIDTHSTPICTEVWNWYARALQHFGNIPTLIEWDTDLPTLDVLLNEAAQARTIKHQVHDPLTLNATEQPISAIITNPTTLAIQAKSSSTHIGNHVVATAQCAATQLLLTQQAFADALQTTPVLTEITTRLKHPETAEDRLAIYRGNVIANLTSALQAAYPVCLQIVGEEFFSGLVRAYRAAYPSTSGDLYEYGHRFSRFLRDFPHTLDMPYLFDVTRLEWAVHCAYACADTSPLDIQVLATCTPEQLETMRFTFRPEVAYLQSVYPIATIWQQHQPTYTGAIDIHLDQPEQAVVYRHHGRVAVAALTSSAGFLLGELLAGTTLGSAVSNTFTQHPDCSPQQALQDFFTLGLPAKLMPSI